MILFQAFFDERHQAEICADLGADTYFVDPTTLDAILASAVDTSVSSLQKLRIFNMAATPVDGKPARMVCKRVAVLDTALNVHHGSTLIISFLEWLVTTQTIDTTLLGRPIL